MDLMILESEQMVHICHQYLLYLSGERVAMAIEDGEVATEKNEKITLKAYKSNKGNNVEITEITGVCRISYTTQRERN